MVLEIESPFAKMDVYRTQFAVLASTVSRRSERSHSMSSIRFVSRRKSQVAMMILCLSAIGATAKGQRHGGDEEAQSLYALAHLPVTIFVLNDDYMLEPVSYGSGDGRWKELVEALRDVRINDELGMNEAEWEQWLTELDKIVELNAERIRNERSDDFHKSLNTPVLGTRESIVAAIDSSLSSIQRRRIQQLLVRARIRIEGWPRVLADEELALPAACQALGRNRAKMRQVGIEAKAESRQAVHRVMDSLVKALPEGLSKSFVEYMSEDAIVERDGDLLLWQLGFEPSEQVGLGTEWLAQRVLLSFELDMFGELRAKFAVDETSTASRRIVEFVNEAARVGAVQFEQRQIDELIALADEAEQMRRDYNAEIGGLVEAGFARNDPVVEKVFEHRNQSEKQIEKRVLSVLSPQQVGELNQISETRLLRILGPRWAVCCEQTKWSKLLSKKEREEFGQLCDSLRDELATSLRNTEDKVEDLIVDLIPMSDRVELKRLIGDRMKEGHGANTILLRRLNQY